MDMLWETLISKPRDGFAETIGQVVKSIEENASKFGVVFRGKVFASDHSDCSYVNGYHCTMQTFKFALTDKEDYKLLFVLALLSDCYDSQGTSHSVEGSVFVNGAVFLPSDSFTIELELRPKTEVGS